MVVRLIDKSKKSCFHAVGINHRHKGRHGVEIGDYPVFLRGKQTGMQRNEQVIEEAPHHRTKPVQCGLGGQTAEFVGGTAQSAGCSFADQGGN